MERLKSFRLLVRGFEFRCFPFPFPDFGFIFSVFLSDPFLLAAAAAFRRVRALTSLGSSHVSKAEHVFFTNFRSMKPRERVASLRCLSVVEVWRRSLAVACQVHNMNRRSRMIELCGSGRRCSKTGIEHYKCNKLPFDVNLKIAYL